LHFENGSTVWESVVQEHHVCKPVQAAFLREMLSLRSESCPDIWMYSEEVHQQTGTDRILKRTRATQAAGHGDGMDR